MASMVASLRQVHHRTMAKVGWPGLNVTLTVPVEPHGVVIVADGLGDNPFAAGDLQVARALFDEGFAVVEVHLLTRREAVADAESSTHRFDTSLLADRIADVITWVAGQPACKRLKVGVFATGTCGAAALRAAVRAPESIDAIVCRAARPELVTGILGRLCADSLLLLGSTDVAHHESNRVAQKLAPPGVIEIALVEGGRPMLDAPAERDDVARMTSAWFTRTLAGVAGVPIDDILTSPATKPPRMDGNTWQQSLR